MEPGGEALEAAEEAGEAAGGGERVALTEVAVPRVVFVVAVTGGMSAARGSLYKSPALVPESRLSLVEMDGLSAERVKGCHGSEYGVNIVQRSAER